MAAKSASARNGRDSHGQRRGVKCYGGEKVTSGSIIVRQRGSQFKPGENVGVGRDWSIYAMVDGTVRFEKTGKRISVEPLPEPAVATAAK